MTDLRKKLAELEAQIKRLKQREAELKRRIIDNPDRWGERHYAHVVGDEVILKEIVHDKK